MRDNPDFGVAISAAVYESGQHQVEFSVTRHGDACCYVGFAVPTIDLDRSKCLPAIHTSISKLCLSLSLSFWLALALALALFCSVEILCPLCKQFKTLTHTMPFQQLGAAVIPGVNAGITSAAA